jgi:hypothetical protein
MASVHRPTRRLLVVAALTAAAAAVPAAAALIGPAPRPATLACPGSINYGILQEGTPSGQNCGSGAIPPSNGGAPSEGALSACSGVPGCLSNYLYGPGNVQVPNVDTTVHQSQ